MVVQDPMAVKFDMSGNITSWVQARFQFGETHSAYVFLSHPYTGL